MSDPKADHNQVESDCIFCGIANKLRDDSQLLYEVTTSFEYVIICHNINRNYLSYFISMRSKDDKYVIIKDIRPAVEHHYLLITKKHIKTAKQLKTGEDIEMCPYLTYLIRY